MVDGYITAVKKLRRAQEMVRNLGVFIMFKRMAELVEKEATRRRHVRHGKFMSVVLANKWKVKTKKMGGSLKAIQLKHIRNNFTFLGLIKKNTQETKASEIIFPVLEKLVQIEEIISKGRRTYKIIELIQNRIKVASITKWAKVEVLENQWDKTLG